MGKRQPLQLGNLASYMQKKIKLVYFTTPYTKKTKKQKQKKLKMLKDFNIRPETIKLLEENIDSTLLESVLAIHIYFLPMSSQAREAKAKISKWGYIKLKSIAQ